MYTYADAAEHLGRKTDRPLPGRLKSTRLQRREDGSIAVCFHGTDVVTYREDRTIVLDSGGWQTYTTKERINEYTRARVYQNRGIWYLGTYGEPSTLFYDRMTIREDGSPIDPRTPEKTEGYKRKLDRMVSRFITGYVRKVCDTSEDFPMPGAGDCLMCQIELGRRLGQGKPLGITTGHLSPAGVEDTTGKRDAFGVEHVLSHMAEGYYVPSLYGIACCARNYGGGPAIGWDMGIRRRDASWIRRDLGYYLRQIKPAMLRLLEDGWQPETD